MRLPHIVTRARAAALLVTCGVLGGGYWALFSQPVVAEGETATVTKGEYADIAEIRGQVQPMRTTLVTAPYNAGELQILKIASTGAAVKAGDVVAEFDAVTLRRTIQEKQSELRSAIAELEQGDAQSQITVEERQAAVARGRFEVTKAQLALGEIGLVSEIDAARAKLALADAEVRLREAEAALDAAKATAKADRETRERRIQKVKSELARAEGQVAALHVKAPVDGIVNILPNFRGFSPTVPQEFRAGDRAYPGAAIMELPDLSTVFLTARLDEADRGQLSPGQTAVVRVDAVADRDYHATVRDISLLARTDFTGGWPPPKQFDLTLAVNDPDARLRPGMSAAARITVGRLPDVLLVPPACIFFEEGRTVVYRLNRRGFEATPVQIIRRGRDQAAVSGALSAGDRIARARPGEEKRGSSR